MLNFRDMSHHKGNKSLKFPLLRGLAVTLAGATAMVAPVFAQQQPIESRAANGVGQMPLRADQTRAPQPATLTQVATQVIAADLPPLWAMEFLPDGRMLTTVKAGAMQIVGQDGTLGAEISGLPDVDAGGQGGLLDVALSPQFETDNRVFFSFSEPRADGNGTAVGSAKLVFEGDAGRLEDVKVIFRQTPSHDGNKHFGSRLVFGAQGELFVTVGERSDAATRHQAGDPASGFGKVFRIDATGAAISDNPFVGVAGALPEIWSLGHRNMQSATLDDKGRLWTVEHGPRGGDELNRPEAGLNYGWPEVTYGIDYSGAAIGDGITANAATEQPVYYWDPVIAPSGMAFYQGKAFPEWNGAFLVGGLGSQSVVVLHMKDDRVAFEEQVAIGARVRDVKTAPDGSVYVVTDGRSGSSQILRLTKA